MSARGGILLLVDDEQKIRRTLGQAVALVYMHTFRGLSYSRTIVHSMAMGKRKRDRQPTMWVATTHLPTAASHPSMVCAPFVVGQQQEGL